MNFSLDYNGNKGFRLLSIYERLNRGELINKSKLSADFGVTSKTIQRDIDDLRAYLSETHSFEAELAIKFDKKSNGYYLVRFEREWLTNEEVLALCKILLESRAFEKSELKSVMSKLIAQVVESDRKAVESLIDSEYKNYVPLKHGKKLFAPIWELSCYITKNEVITFNYRRQDGTARSHKVKPVAIMFSEFYFYLISYMADDSKDFPTVFRIDRIDNVKGTKEVFSVPYKDKFNAGEFRKRVQFMYAGELKKVIFEFSGPSVEAMLDRLPTATIISDKDGVYTMSAETYGDGIMMWLKSQGDNVKML